MPVFDSNIEALLQRCQDLLEQKECELFQAHSRINELELSTMKYMQVNEELKDELQDLKSENYYLQTFHSQVTAILSHKFEETKLLGCSSQQANDNELHAASCSPFLQNTTVKCDDPLSNRKCQLSATPSQGVEEQFEQVQFHTAKTKEHNKTLEMTANRLESEKLQLIADLNLSQQIVEERVATLSVRFQEYIDLKESMDEMTELVRQLEQTVTCLQQQFHNRDSQQRTPEVSPTSITGLSTNDVICTDKIQNICLIATYQHASQLHRKRSFSSRWQPFFT
jgi:intein-encoded DNA endonuclease-like protein